ncbi:cytochrome P450 alkane hydroxylase protein [Rutstroemia sp. NJR-2017a BBW]|nr:cytochrome P450 alkane hydroxylase protein [Rutstroemia sp. NJR-2017a BBW]
MATSQYVFLALCSLICSLLVTKIRTLLEQCSFSKKHGCKPVYRIPQTERIIGYGYFKEQVTVAKDKTMWSATAMGRVFINTIDPDNIKAILATNFEDFGFGHRMYTFGPLLGEGIFTTDGVVWEHSRILVCPNFSKVQVSDLSTFEVHISELINQIPRDGSIVDLQQLFFKLTLDSATEFLFTAFDFAQNKLFFRPKVTWIRALFGNNEFYKACRTVYEFADKIVQDGLANKKIHDTEKLRDEESSSRERDTTASLLSNTFHVLARRPDIWNRLSVEVNELGGQRPDNQTLRNIKYLKNVINKLLRLYPVVSTNTRFANKNTIIPHGRGLDGLSQSLFQRGRGSSTQYSRCIGVKRSTAQMPTSFVPTDERLLCVLDGATYLLMGALGSVSVNNLRSQRHYIQLSDCYKNLERLRVVTTSLGGNSLG